MVKQLDECCLFKEIFLMYRKSKSEVMVFARIKVERKWAWESINLLEYEAIHVAT